jgi:hypothetical protein
LYASPDIIRQVKSRQMRWAGHVARMGEERIVYKVLVGKPEGKTPLGRPRRRWEDGSRMDLGLGVCGLDATGSGQGPVAGCCECGDEPSGSCATELISYVYWGTEAGVKMSSVLVLWVVASCKHILLPFRTDVSKLWHAGRIRLAVHYYLARERTEVFTVRTWH